MQRIKMLPPTRSVHPHPFKVQVAPSAGHAKFFSDAGFGNSTFCIRDTTSGAAGTSSANFTSAISLYHPNSEIKVETLTKVWEFSTANQLLEHLI